MSNYNWKIDMKNTNDSHALILNQIASNSVILEIGPATGAMTEYLQKEKNCSVYIVEYDSKSFEIAKKYAVHGICGDVECVDLHMEFAGLAFDYIIFADVLEHLLNPQAVLQKCKSLLKAKGQVILSIPNISYNGLIPELLSNDFKYRKNGILDETHRHFFSYNSLCQMIYECGFSIEKMDVTYMNEEKSEFAEIWNKTSQSVKNFLKKREKGSVYQYIARLVPDKNCSLKKIDCMDQLYESSYHLAIFDENERIIQEKTGVLDHKDEIKVDLPLDGTIAKIELKPTKNNRCIVKEIFITCGEDRQEGTVVNGYNYNHTVYFDTQNPLILFENLKGKSGIYSLHADVLCCNEEEFRLLWETEKNVWEEARETKNINNALRQQCSALKTENQALEVKKQDLEIEKYDLETRMKNLTVENKDLKIKKQSLAAENEDLKIEKQRLAAENGDLKIKKQSLAAENGDLKIKKQSLAAENAYHQIEIKALEKDKAALEDRVVDYRNKYLETGAQVQVWTDMYQSIYNSTTWKMTLPIRKTMDVVKHLIRKNRVLFLLGKAFTTMRMYGFKAMLLRVKQYMSKKKELKEMQVDGNPVFVKKDYVPYDSEYQENQIYSQKEVDVKALAFYLPQFHSFPENDKWWGKGFTEWNNTTKSVARFDGHYQPRTPHPNIGYYDLSDFETMRKQIELAKQHGLYGFCFYYYWFSGKRLMEKPVDMLLKHPEVDFPFCLCWANENWTRAWDGQNKNVLIAQKYSQKDDNNFILDMKKYIDDRRYIRINGKPLIVVYNPGQIPDCKKTFSRWRERAIELGIGEILIWTCQTANNTAKNLNIEAYVDGELEFPPHNMWFSEIGIRNLDLKGKAANIYNYQMLVDILAARLKKEKKQSVPLHHACMMGWDNAARRPDNWTTYYAYSIKSFYKWLRALIEESRRNFPKEERVIFVNAWNEWAEGTYLEPDKKYGYANINTFSKAIYDLPFEDKLEIVSADQSSGIGFSKSKKQPKIAIQVHMFYLETAPNIIENLNMIPYSYDCYISTDTEEKAEQIRTIFAKDCSATNVFVGVFPNRGRDVAPFLTQMAPVFHTYDYIGHIHSKKTKTGDYGDGWRQYLFHHLFGGPEYLKRVFAELEQEKDLGIVFPETYPLLVKQAIWGGNKAGCHELLHKLGIVMELLERPVFPVGNMFWAKTCAVAKMFEAGFTAENFPKESGQTNLTLGHQIERSWVYIARDAGYQYKKIFNNIDTQQISQKKRLSVYVHYDANNLLSEDDLHMVKALSDISQEVIFVTNSKLKSSAKKAVSVYAGKYIQRENNGYDFGGWKDALLETGLDNLTEFDQLILTNNSYIKTKISMNSMFAKMEAQAVDFWGITMFPFCPDGSFLKRDSIPAHLQSFFQVYNKKAFTSKAFKDFWTNTGYYNDYIEVVGKQECVLTGILTDAGLKGSAYLQDSDIMCSMLGNYALPFEKPYELTVLGCPFIKKKAFWMASDEEIIKVNSFRN